MDERGEGELITFPGVAAFGHGDVERKKGKDDDDEKKDSVLGQRSASVALSSCSPAFRELSKSFASSGEAIFKKNPLYNWGFQVFSLCVA